MATWIVNDYLTCIPGTKTFWHLLLEIDGTVDKTNCPFPGLAGKIENDPDECELIIRNGTFFRPIKRDCKQIAFIQDVYADNTQAKEVLESAIPVFNSQYTKEKFGLDGKVIPIGVNEKLFKPMAHFKHDNKKTGIFVGDYNDTKNTKLFEQLAKEKSYINFLYISKASYTINLPNVRNFTGGVNEQQMARLYNQADFCVFTSPVETLHLASIEAALCNKPVIGTNTGWLAHYYSEDVGVRIDEASFDNFSQAIDEVLSTTYSPREYMLTTPYTWNNCKSAWEKLIKEVLDE